MPEHLAAEIPEELRSKVSSFEWGKYNLSRFFSSQLHEQQQCNWIASGRAVTIDSWLINTIVILLLMDWCILWPATSHVTSTWPGKAKGRWVVVRYSACMQVAHHSLLFTHRYNWYTRSSVCHTYGKLWVYFLTFLLTEVPVYLIKLFKRVSWSSQFITRYMIYDSYLNVGQFESPSSNQISA